VAEDNPTNRLLVTRMLQMRGHEPVVVSSGSEVLAALEQDRFDVILMDVQMPEMDGFQTTTAIRVKERGEGQHTPIVAMTAHAMKGDRERCLDAGMDGYVSKPLRMDELFRAIEAFRPRAAQSRKAEPEVAQPDLLAAAGEPSDDAQILDEAHILDEAALLKRIGGSRALFREVIEILRADYPAMVLAIRRAVEAGDASRLLETAHALKGSISYFGAKKATEAVTTLEQMGRAGEMKGAGEIFGQLEREVEKLRRALEAISLRGRESTDQGQLQKYQ
jgi:CheY-like chemotaxis protein